MKITINAQTDFIKPQGKLKSPQGKLKSVYTTTARSFTFRCESGEPRLADSVSRTPTPGTGMGAGTYNPARLRGYASDVFAAR